MKPELVLLDMANIQEEEYQRYRSVALPCCSVLVLFDPDYRIESSAEFFPYLYYYTLSGTSQLVAVLSKTPLIERELVYTDDGTVVVLGLSDQSNLIISTSDTSEYVYYGCQILVMDETIHCAISDSDDIVWQQAPRTRYLQQVLDEIA